jgi:hypothetical protein
MWYWIKEINLMTIEFALVFDAIQLIFLSDFYSFGTNSKPTTNCGLGRLQRHAFGHVMV